MPQSGIACPREIRSRLRTSQKSDDFSFSRQLTTRSIHNSHHVEANRHRRLCQGRGHPGHHPRPQCLQGQFHRRTSKPAIPCSPQHHGQTEREREREREAILEACTKKFTRGGHNDWAISACTELHLARDSGGCHMPSLDDYAKSQIPQSFRPSLRQLVNLHPAAMIRSSSISCANNQQAPIRPDVVHAVHTGMNKNRRQPYAV